MRTGEPITVMPAIVRIIWRCCAWTSASAWLIVLIGPAGMPAASSCANHSSAGFCRMHSLTSRTISSRFATRAAFVREAIVAHPFRMAANFRQPGELTVVADGDDQRLIGRRERLVRHDVRMRIALPRRVLARDQGVGNLVREHRQLRVEQGHVDVRALARPLAPEQGREDGDAVYMPVKRSTTATPTRSGPPPG